MPEIFAAPSLEALEGVIIRNARDFNHDHVAASIARLASLMGAETGADQSVGRPREGPARKRELAQAQRLLSGLCSALLRFPATVSARQITTGLRTLALLAPQDSEDLSLQLCKLLVAGDGRRMEAAEGMEAVLIAWALVKLPNGVPEPAAAYTEALVAEADGPKRGGGGGDAAAPSDPTDTEQRDAIYRRLWQLLAIAAVRLAPSMERGLGTMLWSFGRAHQDQDGRLAEALATRAADTAPFLMARDLVPMTFAYAQHHVRRQRGVEAQWRQQLADLQGLHGPSGARAIERLRAVLPRAVKNLLPELLSWQLAALLASLRLAGISDPELIQMALPQVVDAAKHYGSTSHLAPRPWNVSWQHLSQLAVGCLPLGVKAADLAVAGSAVDTDATGESLDCGGGFDAAGNNDEEQAREDELAAALTTAAAAAAKGGAAAAPQSHAAARAAISAVAAAAQRLMQREQERCQLRATEPLERSGVAMSLQVWPQRSSAIVRATAAVLPEAAPALALAFAEHALRSQQLPVLSLRALLLDVMSMNICGLVDASLLRGEFYPAVCDALVARLPAARAGQLAGFAGRLSLLQPPPAGVLRMLEGPLAAKAGRLSGVQLSHVVSAYTSVPFSMRPRPEDVGEAPEALPPPPPGAPQHWAWDLSLPAPPAGAPVGELARAAAAAAAAASADGAAEGDGGGGAEDVPGRLVPALAARLQEIGAAKFGDLVDAPPQLGRPAVTAGEDSVITGRMVATLAGLRQLGHADAAYYARFLAPALGTGGALQGAGCSEAADLLFALGGSGGGGGGSGSSGGGAGGEGSGEEPSRGQVLAVGADLARRLDAGGLGQLPEEKLRTLQGALGVLSGWCDAASAREAAALEAAQAAVAEALASK